VDESTIPPKKKLVLDLDLEQFQPVPEPVPVTFLPGQNTVVLEQGESVFEAAKRLGIAIPSTCGGKGTCGRCKVALDLPAREPTYVERQFLTRAELGRGVRLSCRTRPHAPLRVTVLAEPPTSR